MNIDYTQIPISLSRRAFTALLVARSVMDEITGEVPGGIWQLAEILDVDYRNARASVAECEAAGLMRCFRKGDDGTRVYVAPRIFSSTNADRSCEACKRPLAESVRNAQRWCPRCRQIVGRADRAWIPKAITLAVEGKSPPEIAAILAQPLWRRREDDEGQCAAVVPLLLAEGLIDDVWYEALKDQVGCERALALVHGAGVSFGSRA